MKTLACLHCRGETKCYIESGHKICDACGSDLGPVGVLL